MNDSERLKKFFGISDSEIFRPAWLEVDGMIQHKQNKTNKHDLHKYQFQCPRCLKWAGVMVVDVRGGLDVPYDDSVMCEDCSAKEDDYKARIAALEFAE